VRICLTSQGRDLSAQMDPNFGRARYFVFLDEDGTVQETVENAPGAHGAGVQAAQIVSEHKATVVISGSVGPNAHSGLQAAGITVYTGATGTVQQALEAYRQGKLSHAAGPTGGRHGGGGRG
jgi:predicted Fe-Mo cluster-binding NifX family protein